MRIKPVACMFRLPEPGQRLAQGEKGWQVEVNDATVDLLSPVRGEVLEVNEDALRAPSLLGEDPYGQGWLMKVRVPSDRTTLRNLVPDRLANDWIDKSSEELSALLGGELGPVLQDGGVPVSGFARVCTDDRDPDLQIDALARQGIPRSSIFMDKCPA